MPLRLEESTQVLFLRIYHEILTFFMLSTLIVPALVFSRMPDSKRPYLQSKPHMLRSFSRSLDISSNASGYSVASDIPETRISGLLRKHAPQLLILAIKRFNLQADARTQTCHLLRHTSTCRGTRIQDLFSSSSNLSRHRQGL